jgi:hypothetical protein
MDTREAMQKRWRELATLLPCDVNETALLSGAIRRRRQIRDGVTLVRLALAYAFVCGSLRGAAAWAQANGIGSFTDVAVLKRLRLAAPWLGSLLTQMLAERARFAAPRFSDLRVRLIDATSISRRGSVGTDWRIHMGFDLGAFRIDHLEVTGADGGETFARHAVGRGEVLLADRGYAHRRGIHSVASAGAHVVVRITWRNLPLLDDEGKPLDILAAVRMLEAGDIADIPVQVAPDPKASIPAVTGRLVVLRKSEEVAEHTRASILAQARKKGHRTDPRTLEAAAYVFVFTTLPRDRLSVSDVMELYRFRWQIELAFKRLKSITQLDEMAAHDPDLCRAYLCSKLIGALLMEDLTQRLETFSPWGYASPRVDAVAHLQHSLPSRA